jgi:hypothetical protein
VCEATDGAAQRTCGGSLTGIAENRAAGTTCGCSHDTAGGCSGDNVLISRCSGFRRGFRDCHAILNIFLSGSRADAHQMVVGTEDGPLCRAGGKCEQNSRDNANP